MGSSQIIPTVGGSSNAGDIGIADVDNEFNSANVEDALTELAVKEDKNGYDRYDTDSMPDVTYTEATRTISVAVKSGQTSFHFWVNNKKVTKTTTQTVAIPDTTGSYYIYFDDSGTLQYVIQGSVPDAAFYKYAITAFIYYNKDYPTEYLFNPDELHGKDESGATHASLHNTLGAQYSHGLLMNGLVDGNDTYTSTNSGIIYDEDIKHELSSNSSGTIFLYRYGTNGWWRKTTASLNVSYNAGGTYDVWNENTGSTYQLTEGTSTTDFWIQFLIATPLGDMRIIGQNAYSSIRKARNAIESEINDLKLDGLPSPEFVTLGAYIVKRTGEAKAMADGSMFYPLTTSGRGAGGIGSGSTVYAADVPTDVTNFDGILSSTDTDVQTALETIDDITTADVSDSTDKRYCTDAEKTVIGNTSGTNTGDQDLTGYFNKSSDDMDDISNGTTYVKTENNLTDTLKTKLDGIETGAEVNTVDSVAGKTGTVTLTKSDVGLSNVVNLDTSNASNITSGILTSSVLPPIAMTTVVVIANESAQLALTAEEGDVAVRSDENKSYMKNNGTAGTMSDWTELQTPTDSVLSVNGETGTIVLNQDDVLDGSTYVRTQNDLTDTLKTKLDGIETGAEVNNISDANATDLTDAGDSTLHYHATDRARTNHTGTQTASTISDFDTEVSNNSSVTANTSKVTNATHTGEVTGSTALTIADNVVDEANLKLDSSPTNDQVLTADSSKTGGMKWASLTTQIPHAYTIQGEIKVPSGDTDFIPQFYVPVPSGKTVKVVKCTYKINSGTSATVKLQKNGSDITGFTSISVTTTKSSTTPTAVSLADGDAVALVVTAVSGTPKNMSFTIIIEYS